MSGKSKLVSVISRGRGAWASRIPTQVFACGWRAPVENLLLGTLETHAFRRLSAFSRRQHVEILKREVCSNSNIFAPLKVFVVAGESSGDLLAARLMAALRTILPSGVTFQGVGGNAMQSQGLVSLFPMEDIAVMGLAELVPHLPRLAWRLHSTARAVMDAAPHVLITVDAKGFNLRLARRVRQMATAAGSPPPTIVHYVAPSFWAFKGGAARLPGLGALVDQVLCLLPHEPGPLRAAGVPAVFVGHPVVEDCIQLGLRLDRPIGVRESPIRGALPIRDELGPSCSPVITVLPGSRRQELRRHLPLFSQAIAELKRSYPNVACVMPLLPSLIPEGKRQISDSWPCALRLVPSESTEELYAALRSGDIALSASGTATLQLVAAHVPCVVGYRCHPLTQLLAKHLAVVRHVSLPNIFSTDGESVIPEAVFFECTPVRLAILMNELLKHPDQRYKQIERAANFLQTLSPCTNADHEGLVDSYDSNEVSAISRDSNHRIRPSILAAHAVLNALNRKPAM